MANVPFFGVALMQAFKMGAASVSVPLSEIRLGKSHVVVFRLALLVI